MPLALKCSCSMEMQMVISSESYIILAVIAMLGLVALIYLLSPMSLLEDITTRGAEIRTRLREFLARPTYTTDTRTVLVIGAADQALEHHEAVWRLRASKLNGSALAMIRLVWDAMFRTLDQRGRHRRTSRAGEQ